MGQWTLVVEGCGPHHNDKPFDAERLAQDFVSRCVHLGHSIEHASIAISGRSNLSGVAIHRESFEMERAAIAYEAYRTFTGGVSLATRQPIPAFGDLPDAIRDAWRAAANALIPGA